MDFRRHIAETRPIVFVLLVVFVGGAAAFAALGERRIALDWLVPGVGIVAGRIAKIFEDRE